MPFSYDIDPIQRVVTFRISGALTPAEMTAVRTQLKSDPAFRPDFDQINDLRGASGIAMSSDQIRETAGHSVFNPDARIAIVVTRDNPVTFGMVRMYELLRTASDPNRVGIFDTVEDAAQWLRASRGPSP